GELDLTADERQADRGFLRGWCAVAGRPPWHDIGDVRRATIETDRRHHAVEQFAGSSDEGTAENIFVVTRRLTDEHDAALRIAVGKNQLRRRCPQRAAFEAGKEHLQFVQRGGGPRRFTGRHHGGLRRYRRGRWLRVRGRRLIAGPSRRFVLRS